MSKKTRLNISFFDPPGEELKGSRPPTIYEIVKYKNFLKYSTSSDTNDRDLIKIILPKLMGIWSKVHPALPLRTELSISNHLCQIFEKYANCRNKRVKAAVVKNIIKTQQTLFIIYQLANVVCQIQTLQANSVSSQINTLMCAVYVRKIR